MLGNLSVVYLLQRFTEDKQRYYTAHTITDLSCYSQDHTEDIHMVIFVVASSSQHFVPESSALAGVKFTEQQQPSWAAPELEKLALHTGRISLFCQGCHPIHLRGTCEIESDIWPLWYLIAWASSTLTTLRCDADWVLGKGTLLGHLLPCDKLVKLDLSYLIPEFIRTFDWASRRFHLRVLISDDKLLLDNMGWPCPRDDERYQ